MSLFTYKDSKFYSSSNSGNIIAYALNDSSKVIINNAYNLNIQSGGRQCAYTISDSPNPLNYQINGTDISSYCIASYYDALDSESYSGWPSWATSIRAVLVGGGGGGSSSIIQNQYHNENSGYNTGLGATNEFHHQQHQDTRSGGNSGGGGGFVYISNLPISGIQSLQVVRGQHGLGGQATAGEYANGGNADATYLNLYINNQRYYFAAYGGSGKTGGQYHIPQGTQASGASGHDGGTGANVTGSAGGTIGTPNIQGISAKSGITYGNGGLAGGNNKDWTEVGGMGNKGYFRIYFLK